MLEKYFGFFEVKDEDSIVESFLEHSRIDEEEIVLLGKVIDALIIEDKNSIEDSYYKIKKINADSYRIFEQTSEQIIQANFGLQKQSDLLRIYQRIEKISHSIIVTSNALVILSRISTIFSIDLMQYIQKMIVIISKMHSEFISALTQYQQQKNEVIKTIHRIEDLDKSIYELRSLAVQTLYKLGNDGKLPMGTFTSFDNVFKFMEHLTHHIEEAATSIEWLLITPQK